jgi:glycosyltransferase involved in cell wall biosynthesis
MKHILIIASYGPSLINFRLPLIKRLLSRGYKVSVASPIDDFSDILQKKLQDLGIYINIFKLSRTRFNLLINFNSLIELYKIVKNSKPNIIISYTAKPVIFSGLVLKFFKKVSYYPLITGLGFSFTEINSIKKIFFRYLISQLYRQGLKSSKKIIFQNKDDQSLFYKLKILDQSKISYVINGSGVDLSEYPLTNLPSKRVFLMIARLLGDKGVREYVNAAKIVKSRFPDVTFQLAGYLDENPSAVTADELQTWINDGNIEYLGEIKFVQSILKSCKYYVLPSYREGTPRSVLEALSTGRPIITTDAPGCRETVVHEKNGLLVPIKDPISLANAMIRLLNEKDETIEKMAKESYLIAKNKYDIDKVNQSIINIMNL